MFNSDGVKYYKPSIYRLPGEWILVQCDESTEISLAFKRIGAKFMKDLPVDHNKIKRVEWNVYNVTNLTYDDTGEYVCNRVSRPSGGTIYRDEVARQDLAVLKEGKRAKPYK